MKTELAITAILMLAAMMATPLAAGSTEECHLNDAVEIVCATADSRAQYVPYDDVWNLDAYGSHWSAVGLSIVGELQVTSSSTTFGGTDLCTGGVGTVRCHTHLASHGVASFPPGGLCVLAKATTIDAGLLITAIDGTFC